VKTTERETKSILCGKYKEGLKLELDICVWVREE